MSLPTQSIGGLVSGFDTANIIDSLMAIERRPVTKMENKIKELEAQQEAYKSLSSMMLTFKSKVDFIGQYSNFNMKTAFSSNESILSANAYEGAQPGSYTFSVERLAQTNQHVSSGYSNTDSSPVGAGTISIDSGKASFKNSTKLAELNGNMGVSRGSIRITDRSGKSAIIDLSGSEAIDDVLEKINNNYNIDIKAEISTDGRGLTIKDMSGSTASDLIIENYGSGSMADDLGIATTGTAGDLVGGDIFTLNQTSSLNLLRDGLGVEKGILHITDNVSSENYDLDLSKADSIKDVLDEINAITDAGGATVFNAQITGQGLEITNILGNDFTITDDVSSEMATQLGIAGNSTGNMLTGSDLIGKLDTVMLENISGKTGGAFTAGIIDITDRSGVLTSIDLTGAKTLSDVINGINDSGAGVTAEINNVGNGITIKDTTGATASNLIIQDNTGDLTSFFGITKNAAVNEVDSGDLDRNYISRATLLSSLNGGEGVYEGSIKITDANGVSSTGNLSGVKTVGEVITAINNSGLAVQAQINSTGDGIEIINTTGSGEIRVEESDKGSAAADLGILGSASGGGSIDGSFETKIDVSSEDTLSSLVYKVALSKASVSTSIIDDGSGINQHHLSITSTTAGKAGELMIDTDIFGLEFNESAEAQDALLLYGGGSSGSSPMLISNNDNNFRSAVPGMTISANQAKPGEQVTVTVNRDTDGIVTAIEEMVSSFNDYSEVHDVLTRWDEENEAPGLLFGDSQANNMMNEIQDMMLTTVEGLDGGISQWYDVGIKFKYNQETKKTRLELDSSTLREKLSSNFESVRDLMTLSKDVASSGYNAGITSANPADNGTSLENLLNGNISSGDFPSQNGYQSTNVVNDDEIILSLDKPRAITQIAIHHIDSPSMPAEDYAISDYLIEFWDDAADSWKVAREYMGNTSPINYTTLPSGTMTDKIRLTVKDTNAPDKKIRLLEIQAMENQGTASRLRSTLSSITDSIDGVFKLQDNTIEDKISDLEKSIENMEARMEMKETSLINQWTSMETTLSQLQSQGDYFMQQMDAMNSNNK